MICVSDVDLVGEGSDYQKVQRVAESPEKQWKFIFKIIHF